MATSLDREEKPSTAEDLTVLGSSGTSEHQCDICGKVFSSRLIATHKYLHSMDGKICGECGVGNSPVLLLKNARTKHRKPPTARVCCSICKRVFLSIAGFRKHATTRHWGRRVKPRKVKRALKFYKCSNCYNRFKALRYISRYAASKHCVLMHPCPYCPDSFRFRLNMAQHIVDKHLGLSCNVCGARFDERWKIRSHMRIYRNISHAVCSQAGCDWIVRFDEVDDGHYRCWRCTYEGRGLGKALSRSPARGKRYQCIVGDCIAVYSTEDRLRKHEGLHRVRVPRLIPTSPKPVEKHDMSFLPTPEEYL